MPPAAIPDALQTLIRLRQSEQDAASRDLGEAVTAEATAEATRRAAEQAILRETQIAAQSDEDVDVERFALWLQRARARLRAAEQALEDAASVTASRRAALSLARAATEATTDALARRRLHERQQRERIAQREQDEIGQRRGST